MQGFFVSLFRNTPFYLSSDVYFTCEWDGSLLVDCESGKKEKLEHQYRVAGYAFFAKVCPHHITYVILKIVRTSESKKQAKASI